MARDISEIDWSVEGGFGLPWNYYAQELALRASKGEELSEDEWKVVEGFAELQIAIIDQQKDDPLHNMWRTEGMDKALEYLPKARVLVLLGGNRAGKSEIGSAIAVKTALEIPGAYISVWSENERLSIDTMQSKVHSRLPFSFNDRLVAGVKKKKGDNWSLDWKQKTGFSGNKCIIPPVWPMQESGSEITFKFYSQFMNSNQVSEGYKSDLEMFDEEPPLELFKRAQRRVIDKNGKVVWPCTLVEGYGELAGYILDGAITLESRYVEFLGTDVPLVQKSVNLEDCYIVYLHTDKNPFLDKDVFYKSLSGLTLEEKKVVGFGVPTKMTTCRFPRFSVNVNVFDDEQMPTKDITRYLMVDPAGRKPFAMVWYAVDKRGHVWIYREWPDRGTYGPWAEPGNDAQSISNKYKGKAGPALKQVGYGFSEYVAMIKKLEGDEMIAMRYMDPRGNKVNLDDSGQISVIEKMAQHGMFFFPALGENDIDPGIQRINDYLAYNVNEPITSENSPKLHIHKRCGNLIYAMQNYTGLGGYEEFNKDWIDIVRYLLASNPVHFGKVKGFSKNGYERYY